MSNSSINETVTVGKGKANQFDSVNVLRFLLIILVVFIHENPTFENQGYTGVFVHTVAQSAVPLFFMLAGFFFFYKKQIMTVDFYRGQMKKRFFTLLIPYLIWNWMPAINITAGNLFSIVFKGKSIDALCEYWQGLWNDGIWHIYWDKVGGTMPYDSPLWFLRDLIILCVLTPVFHYLIKKMRHYFILALLIAYLSGMVPSVPGFGILPILFFCIGIYFALEKISFIELCKKYAAGICVLSAVCVAVILYMQGRYVIVISQLSIILNAAVLIILTNLKSGGKLDILLKWSETVFFIYALHNTCVLAFTGKMIIKATPFINNGSMAGNVFYYLVTPFVAVAVCMIIYYIMKKICPSVLSVLTGGRI